MKVALCMQATSSLGQAPWGPAGKAAPGMLLMRAAPRLPAWLLPRNSQVHVLLRSCGCPGLSASPASAAPAYLCGVGADPYSGACGDVCKAVVHGNKASSRPSGGHAICRLEASSKVALVWPSNVGMPHSGHSGARPKSTIQWQTAPDGAQWGGVEGWAHSYWPGAASPWGRKAQCSQRRKPASLALAEDRPC